MRTHMRTQYVEKYLFFLLMCYHVGLLVLHVWPSDILSWLNSPSFWFTYFSSFYLNRISWLWFVNLLKKHKQYTEADFSLCCHAQIRLQLNLMKNYPSKHHIFFLHDSLRAANPPIEFLRHWIKWKRNLFKIKTVFFFTLQEKSITRYRFTRTCFRNN